MTHQWFLAMPHAAPLAASCMSLTIKSHETKPHDLASESLRERSRQHQPSRTVQRLHALRTSPTVRETLPDVKDVHRTQNAFPFSVVPSSHRITRFSMEMDFKSSCPCPSVPRTLTMKTERNFCVIALTSARFPAMRTSSP